MNKETPHWQNNIPAYLIPNAYWVRLTTWSYALFKDGEVIRCKDSRDFGLRIHAVECRVDGGLNEEQMRLAEIKYLMGEL